MRSARSRRKSCIISTMRRTPCSVKAPETTGLLRVGQAHVEPPRVRHLGLDVVVRRERRGQVRDVRQAVGEADVLDEVGRVGEARLAGPMVEDLEAARAGHEVDPIAAEVGVRVALAVVQDERARRGLRSPSRRRRAGRGRGRSRPGAGRGRGGAGAGSAPRTSMPTSARIRFASSRMRAMRSGSRIERVGRMGPASIPAHGPVLGARPCTVDPARD